VLLEHEAAKWLSKEQLNSVDWLPADQIVIDSIISFNNNVIPLV
jgi:8-oxo-dGTP diphosphatase